MADQILPSHSMVRPDFKPEYFDTAIAQKGYKVIWEQGMLCSCYNHDGQPDFMCTTCRGRGYVYFDPKETRALVTSINGHKEQEHIGLYDFGSAYLTPLSTDNVGYRDRFTFLDFTMKFSEVITTTGTQDDLRYPVKSVIALRQRSNVYMEGVDFNISKDGRKVEWISTSINSGEQYSILYNTCPVYIAINPIHELRGTYTMYKQGGLEQFVPLPKQFQIKREDFVDNVQG